MLGYGGGGDPCGWEGRLDDEQGAPGGREMLGEKDTAIIPLMGYGDSEFDFNQKWKAYLWEDGWLVMKGLAQEAVRQGAEDDKNDKSVKDLV